MPRKPGRPPLDPTDRSVIVSVAIPSRTFDTYYKRASVERLTVPEIIRRDLHNYANKKIENR